MSINVPKKITHTFVQFNADHSINCYAELNSQCIVKMLDDLVAKSKLKCI